MARLHTSDGRFVGWSRLPHGLVALAQTVVRKTTGHIPRVPWIPFSARKALEKIVAPDFVVWEIGSGFSTLWLADRAKKVVSIEAAPEWHDKLRALIVAERIGNVDLRFEWEAERMANFADVPEESLHLLLIDGGPRGLCLERGLTKVRRGGYIYLDNWDSKLMWGAAASLPARSRALFSEVHSFIDYVPAQFGVYEGLLLRKA